MEDDKGLVAVLAFGLPPAGPRGRRRPGGGGRRVHLRDLARGRGVSCGIGVSTGLPFCGPLGSPERRVYTVTGADVIRAARLMQIAGDGEIRCDEETWAAARKSAAAPRSPALPRFGLKGFDAPGPASSGACGRTRPTARAGADAGPRGPAGRAPGRPTRRPARRASQGDGRPRPARPRAGGWSPRAAWSPTTASASWRRSRRRPAGAAGGGAAGGPGGRAGAAEPAPSTPRPRGAAASC